MGFTNMILKINFKNLLCKVALVVFVLLSLIKSLVLVIFKKWLIVYAIIGIILLLLTMKFIKSKGIKRKSSVFVSITLFTIFPLLVNNCNIKNGHFSDAFIYISTVYLILILVVHPLEVTDITVVKRLIVDFALVYAAFTWFSYLLPGLYLNTVVPLFSSADQTIMIQDFVNNNMLMGLTNHYSRNAYYITLGCMICCSDMIIYFKEYSKKYINVIILLFLFATLLLVGKRGHMMFLIISLTLTYCLSIKMSLTTFVKSIIKGLIIVLIVFAIVKMIPGTNNFFYRLFNSSNGDISTGRFEIYQRVWQLFKNNGYKAIGWGAFAKSTNYFYVGVHNDYLQLLCETGVIGLMVYVLSNFYNLIKTICLLKMRNIDRRYKSLMFLSVAFQIFFISYSITGVPHYDYEIFVVYLIFSAFPWIIKEGSM